MTTQEMLEALGRDWIIELTTSSAETWCLEVSPLPERRPGNVHIYRGKLASVIARAYHGEPGDERYPVPLQGSIGW